MHFRNRRRIHMSQIIVLILTAFLGNLLSGSAQDQQPESIIVNYVQSNFTPNTAGEQPVDIYFTVVDGQLGAIINPDVASARLSVNGQTYDATIEIPETPLFITMVLDMSGSMIPAFDDLRAAAISAVRAAPDGTSFAVQPFDHELLPLFNFGSDKQAAIDFILGLPSPSSQGGTCLYDAAYSAINITRSGSTDRGRGAVIVFTDGHDERHLGQGDTCSTHSPDDVIDNALQINSNIPVYSIGLRSANGVAQDILQTWSVSTGGLYAFGSQSELSALFQGIISTLTSQRIARFNVCMPADTYSGLLEVRVADSMLGEIVNSIRLTTTCVLPTPTPTPAPLSLNIVPPNFNPATNALDYSIERRGDGEVAAYIVTVNRDDQNGTLQLLRYSIPSEPDPAFRITGTVPDSILLSQIGDTTRILISVQALDPLGAELATAVSQAIAVPRTATPTETATNTPTPSDTPTHTPTATPTLGIEVGQFNIEAGELVYVIRNTQNVPIDHYEVEVTSGGFRIRGDYGLQANIVPGETGSLTARIPLSAIPPESQTIVIRVRAYDANGLVLAEYRSDEISPYRTATPTPPPTSTDTPLPSATSTATATPQTVLSFSNFIPGAEPGTYEFTISQQGSALANRFQIVALDGTTQIQVRDDARPEYFGREGLTQFVDLEAGQTDLTVSFPLNNLPNTSFYFTVTAYFNDQFIASGSTQVLTPPTPTPLPTATASITPSTTPTASPTATPVLAAVRIDPGSIGFDETTREFFARLNIENASVITGYTVRIVLSEENRRVYEDRRNGQPPAEIRIPESTVQAQYGQPPLPVGEYEILILIEAPAVQGTAPAPAQGTTNRPAPPPTPTPTPEPSIITKVSEAVADNPIISLVILVMFVVLIVIVYMIIRMLRGGGNTPLPEPPPPTDGQGGMTEVEPTHTQGGGYSSPSPTGEHGTLKVVQAAYYATGHVWAVPMNETGRFGIGRANENDAKFTETRVSSYHAVLEYRGGAFRIVKESKHENTLKVNDQDVSTYVELEPDKVHTIVLADIVSLEFDYSKTIRQRQPSMPTNTDGLVTEADEPQVSTAPSLPSHVSAWLDVKHIDGNGTPGRIFVKTKLFRVGRVPEKDGKVNDLVLQDAKIGGNQFELVYEKRFKIVDLGAKNRTVVTPNNGESPTTLNNEAMELKAGVKYTIKIGKQSKTELVFEYDDGSTVPDDVPGGSTAPVEPPPQKTLDPFATTGYDTDVGLEEDGHASSEMGEMDIPLQPLMLSPLISILNDPSALSAYHGTLVVEKSSGAVIGRFDIPLNGEHVTIGRDAASIVRFDLNFVSGKHAEIYFDPKDGLFYILDLGSTFGTMIEGADRRVPANVATPLPPKECIIYLSKDAPNSTEYIVMTFIYPDVQIYDQG